MTQGTKYSRGVRVFNSDFVEANIGRFDGPLKHILIVGEENKAIAAELKAEIATRDQRNTRIEAIGGLVAKLETERGRLFSQVAKTIGEATSGSTLRSYRKPDAESAYAKLSDDKPLSAEELEIHRATVRQDEMPAVQSLSTPIITVRGEDVSALAVAAEAAAKTKALTVRSAQAAAIERLLKNPAIAEWVEVGVHIHAGKSTCEFCDQPLSAERLKALGDHFSAEDQQLKEELNLERTITASTTEKLKTFSVPDRLALYSELRADYDSATMSLGAAMEALVANLQSCDKALAEKLLQRTVSYECDLATETDACEVALEAVQVAIKRHNEKTAGFDREKDAARSAIETHYLLEIKSQVEGINKAIEALMDEGALLSNGGDGLEDKRGLAALSQSITAKQAQVLNAHEGGENLTNHLKQFLGRTELKFESGVDGYSVTRRGKPAKRLSEGEKTAIAFLYFLVQLKDQNFDLAEGVVVIDDPISSLDASAIYQAFSFLKNETQNAKQLFILTHNFEFLKLLINWVNNIHGLPKSDRSFSMVLCTETASGRSARLAPLDSLLIDHATEYHYLFKVLYTFKSDGTILGCYHVPNIARKVLETFLDFHLPSNKSLYKKLNDAAFDEHKKTAIYKFSNDLSHHTGKTFDPALVAETQKNTTYLLEMIETLAPLHYRGLKALSEV